MGSYSRASDGGMHILWEEVGGVSAVPLQTDVTMTELEIDMNMRIGEWSIIQESGKQLVPCYGAGYTGMTNLGNSCYLNSIMQVLFSLPHFKQRSEVTIHGIYLRSSEVA